MVRVNNDSAPDTGQDALGRLHISTTNNHELVLTSVSPAHRAVSDKEYPPTDIILTGLTASNTTRH